MSPSATYADILLPLPLSQAYTYLVPEEMVPPIHIGCRVVAPLGSRKLYTGIVVRLHEEKPSLPVKTIYTLLDETPVLINPQLDFWHWIASYYMCSPGEVMHAALPAGLKLESETQVMLCNDFESDGSLKEREQRILNSLLPGKSTSLHDLCKSSGVANILPVAMELVAKGALRISEEIRCSYKPKTSVYVRLAEIYRSKPERLQAFMEASPKAKKQTEILTGYLNLADFFCSTPPKEVGKKQLLEHTGNSPAVFQALCNKGILETYQKEIGRLPSVPEVRTAFSSLSAKQHEALRAIKNVFLEKPICLLHGLTSSGKTEIYIHLIEECLRSGKQALYLVPEIALTTQLSDRLKRVFGRKIGVYHSKFPDAERVEIWNKLLKNQDYQVILGVRSSIFLPFHSLGLVVIDEEHEGSYKQQEPAPRYHARNAALMLASMHGAKTLLGTATPCLETYFNCQSGKYGLVELFSRHFEMELPEIVAVNTKELKRKKIMKTLFSPLLSEKIEHALSAHQQVILFQNRRGYAPVVECKACGWVSKCERCDVSLTYHKFHRKLTCHYCGFEREVPSVCPACGTQAPSTLGFGTEQIEEAVRAQFPNARIARMDVDTTRNRSSYEQIIHDFEAGKTDVLIGTQMVTKGLDFDHVRVVGILNADQMLNFPDFRAYERSFHLMAQVSGRAGRRGTRGTVIIQTADPSHPVVEDVVKNDFHAFYQRELHLRQLFSYPPFTRIIIIRFKHKDLPLVRSASTAFADVLRPVFGKRLLGPDQPPIARVNHYYLQQLFLKVEVGASPSTVKDILTDAQHTFRQKPAFRAVQISFDVDPI